MLTVNEAAKEVGKDPETVRRWIRTGKLRATKIGTQHVIEEDDLDPFLEDEIEVPESWRYFASGRKQPNWAAAVRRSRDSR